MMLYVKPDLDQSRELRIVQRGLRGSLGAERALGRAPLR
jgi:hypothetical protein